MTGLEKIAHELRAMLPDMERLAGVGDSMKFSQALELIDTASLEQCKGMIDAQAKQAQEQLGKLAQQAREEIEAKVAFSIRSIAQRRRWRNFQEFNGRKSK